MMKKLLGNQSGVALMMVMTAILILMALWGDFTFESKVSRIRTVNMLDKTESRLMAETALELAMVRLKLYKEAYNIRQSNENARNSVSVQLLNQLWEVPFIYPVPLPPNASASVKASIAEFDKESLLTGGMKLSIQNISNKMNLNLMRVTQLKANPTTTPPRLGPDGQPIMDPNNPPPAPPAPEDPPDPNKDPMFSMEQQLVTHLSRKFREKADEDESFREKYGSVDVLQLVANLKYYMSDKNPRRQNSTQVDVLMDNSENLFNEAKITPKYGPLSSFSEIYLIPGWDDTLVEIIKGEFDVFPAVMIDLNKLTDGMLKLLIPNISDDEVKAFFVWRDDPNKPQFFNSENDFKQYFATNGPLSSGALDELFNKYKAQGIQFGSAPSLFRIVAEGTANNSSTTLVATVSLPTAPAPARPPGTPPPPPPGTRDANGNPPATPPEQNPQPLLDPRIIDMQIN